MVDKIKILILEDIQSDVELLQRELIKSGLHYSSVIAQTCEEFENALDSFRPDVILADYLLPSFDGVTAFHIKQRKHPDIPFIIVSGTIGEENAVTLIKNGVTDYALKNKLFTLPVKINRALKDAADLKESRIVSEKLKLQNEKLFEIAFLQSHQVRVPVAQILGLFDLFKFDNPNDPVNAEILGRLKIVAKSLDNVIREITKKTSELDAIQ